MILKINLFPPFLEKGIYQSDPESDVKLINLDEK